MVGCQIQRNYKVFEVNDAYIPELKAGEKVPYDGFLLTEVELQYLFRYALIGQRYKGWGIKKKIN